jgi:hypothetical protein
MGAPEERQIRRTPAGAAERGAMRTLGAAATSERRPRRVSPDISKCQYSKCPSTTWPGRASAHRQTVGMPPKPAMTALKAKLAATTALKKGAEKGKEDGAAAAAADGEAKPAAKAKPIPSYLRPTAAGKAKQSEVKHQYKVRWVC